MSFQKTFIMTAIKVSQKSIVILLSYLHLRRKVSGQPSLFPTIVHLSTDVRPPSVRIGNCILDVHRPSVTTIYPFELIFGRYLYWYVYLLMQNKFCEKIYFVAVTSSIKLTMSISFMTKTIETLVFLFFSRSVSVVLSKKYHAHIDWTQLFIQRYQYFFAQTIIFTS